MSDPLMIFDKRWQKAERQAVERDRALRDRLDTAIAALEDAIENVSHHKVSIGSPDSHYMPQISIERVEKWRGALRKARGED